MRNTDQFHVGEHGAGPFAPVIEQHIDAGGHEFVVEAFGRRAHRFRFFHANRADGNGEGRDCVRKDDAARVVSLLDGGADDARDADAVTAHHEEPGFAGLVEIGGFHRFRVFGAKVEHMAHLDAALDCKRALAVGRSVAFAHIADVGDDFGFRQVASPIDPGQVMVPLVGTDDEVAHVGHGAVGHHAHRLFCA